MGNAYTAAVPDDVAAVAAVDEVAVGGVVEHDAEPVTDDVEGVAVTHRNELRAELSDYIQERAGDNGSLSESGLAVKPLRPDSGVPGQEQVEEAEGQVRCTRSVADRSVEMA